MASVEFLEEGYSTLESGNKVEVKKLYDSLFNSLLKNNNGEINFLSDSELIKRADERKGGVRYCLQLLGRLPHSVAKVLKPLR